MNLRSFTLSASEMNRTFNLSDGVFAIAMTLLVFGLSSPAQSPDGSTLSQQLLAMWPQFLLHGLSFLILGMLWMMHHAALDYLEHGNAALGWLNILTLLFATLMPFSTSLAWKHGISQTTALTYGVNFFSGYVMTWLMFCYGTSRPDLIKQDVDPNLVRAIRRMGLVYISILGVSIGLVFVSPIVSFGLYAVFVGTFVVLTMLGRFRVMMLPRTRTHVQAGGGKNVRRR